jgi:hypothetical protein
LGFIQFHKTLRLGHVNVVRRLAFAISGSARLIALRKQDDNHF